MAFARRAWKALGPLAVLAGGRALAQEDAWSRFRGPHGSGVAEASDLPARFGPEAGNVRWRTELPPGRSSPVLAGGRVFLTAFEEKALLTLCLDQESGEVLWRAELPRPRAAKHHPHNSPAAPTPAVDRDTVVVFFQDFGLAAYDHAGAERWRRPLGPFDSHYGMAASPILVDAKVVLPLDQRRGSYLLALALETGEVVWKVDRPAAWEGYATPVLHERADGARELIHNGTFLLESFDVATGERIRYVRGMLYNPKSAPLVHDGVVYVTGYGEARGAPDDKTTLGERDANGDGGITVDELAHAELDRTKTIFLLADLDGDGALDADEFEYHRRIYHHARQIESGVRSTLAIRLDGEGDATDQSYRWNSRGGVGEVPSPLFYRGALYCVSDEGGLVGQLDPKTGAVLARKRLARGDERIFASPVAADGKLFLVSHGGVVHVLDTERGLEPIAVNALGEECYATPALADGAIYLRTEKALWRFSHP